MEHLLARLKIQDANNKILTFRILPFIVRFWAVSRSNTTHQPDRVCPNLFSFCFETNECLLPRKNVLPEHLTTVSRVFASS